MTLISRHLYETDYDWGYRCGMSGDVLSEETEDEFSIGYSAGLRKVNEITEDVVRDFLASEVLM